MSIRMDHSVPSAVKTGAGMLLAAGVGAGLTYFFDPNRGRARRAMAHDKTLKLFRRGIDQAERAAKDVSNRVNGLAHEVEAAIEHLGEPVDDCKLVAHIRTRLGRMVAHPHQVQVTAAGGHVILSGAVQAKEMQSLVLAVRAMAGVREVENRLTTSAPAKGVLPVLPKALAQLAAFAGASSILLSATRKS